MKDNLENRIKELQDQFNIEEPNIGHFERFEAKLARQVNPKKDIKWNPTTWKWLAVAASIVLLVGLWFGNLDEQPGMQLAEVSPEMEDTQSFFVSTIQKELEEINLERNDDNKQVIDDALTQLNDLEIEYNQLTLELEDSNQDKRIIYAMINNFQQRIEVLQTLLEQLDEIKSLKRGMNQA